MPLKLIFRTYKYIKPVIAKNSTIYNFSFSGFRHIFWAIEKSSDTFRLWVEGSTSKTIHRFIRI